MRRRAATVAVVALVLAGCDGRNPSILNPQGPRADEAAFLFWLMLALSTPILLLVTALLVGSALRNRRRTADEHDEPAGSDDELPAYRRSMAWIVAGGIILPVVVIVPLSGLTLVSLNRMEAPPEQDALVVEVEGHRFWWEVRYPGTDAITANEVHIPVGRDVLFVLTTADVIHSFWAANLGGKRDMIPGEVNEVVYRADTAGVWEGVCAEFCGIQHTWMRLLVVAQPEDEFEAWLENQAADAAEPTTESEQLGLETFLAAGCASCHQIRGTEALGRLGPDLTHLADRRSLASVTVDNNRGNLGGWIANPHGVKPGTTMPPSPLPGPELNALLDYLEILR
jgi:cytochrome c oxidase subunit II